MMFESSPVLEDATYLAHCHWMQQALALAATAGTAGDIPVGAVIVGPGDTCLAATANHRQRAADPTAHAEILALRQAGQALGTWHLEQCVLYVTLEPCPMCAGAIILSRLGLLVYGVGDPKAGAIRSVVNLPDSACSNHRLPVLAGILAEPCQRQLSHWFRQRRQA
ncbi:tRNA-specific adenosine deaminase [Halomicronema hongdechloris C2206]|uniref:tRNA-specific adenosine deaminase n=1 Tax=Halomicronema hongdechloris C2206 TaxID=1641165 RepID=A0A1Z3HNU3_9CYAN|nr:tRNA adenosine(34) deaminase TadA [Halomicronema hongdechloris]ASC71955.1 tRNA-specific adenosine deaminase [Halomicronema hongdechloris C2206]